MLLKKRKVTLRKTGDPKVVERAKGLLMEKQGLSEQEAFRKIQKASMNNRKSMREVAEAILLTNEMIRQKTEDSLAKQADIFSCLVKNEKNDVTGNEYRSKSSL